MLNKVNPSTLSVTHICDGEEVITGGDDGQVWIGTFADRSMAVHFVNYAKAHLFHVNGERRPEKETGPAPRALHVEPGTSDLARCIESLTAPGELYTVERQETSAEPPRPGCEEWWHLKQYGYAPGGYIITCFDCKQNVWDCDKRASICRPCAEKRHSAKTGICNCPSGRTTAHLPECPSLNR